MTGITKDELMQMAREAGIEFKPMRIEDIDYKYREVHFNDSIGGDEAGCIELLLNAILERAAAECDATKTRYKGMAEEEDKTLLKAGECSDYWSHVFALAGAAYDIRALKINTGD